MSESNQEKIFINNKNITYISFYQVIFLCGIVGICSREVTNIGKILKDSLIRLEYRGYDSAGIATISDSKLIIKKDVGRIEDIDKKVHFEQLFGKVGIGHTRWATHGPPSKINSHPHIDCKKEIAVVHNGIIENYLKLKEKLKESHTLVSDTDTEIVPHLLESFLDDGFSFEESVKKVVSLLKGSFAFGIISIHDKNSLICVKKDSPLVLGVSDDAVYCASDIPAFLPYTRKVIILEDGDIAFIKSPDEISIYNMFTKSYISREKFTVTWSEEMAKKGGYPHFYLKEVHEQPKAIKDTLKFPEKKIKQFSELLEEVNNIYMVAAGTSYHATLVGEYLFLRETNLKPRTVISSEFDIFIPHISREDLIFAVSQSGETADTIKAIKQAKERKAKIVSIVNVVGSTISRLSDLVYYTNAGPEISVAATKSYITQLVAIYRILADYLKKYNPQKAHQIINGLNKMPEFINLVIQGTEETIRRNAEFLAQKDNFFFLGRGLNIATAMEGSLKLKEISYVHSEAYPAGESKHGPIALISKDFPVVFVAPPDEAHSKIIGNIMEMRARGAYIITVIQERDTQIVPISNLPIQIPHIDPILTPIPYVIPLQLLAYYVALARGAPIDKPRNLAKSVTVL